MVLQLVIAVAAFVVLFVMFLVISRTMNNMINQLSRIEYFLRKELDFSKESREIEKLLKEKAKSGEPAEDEKE